MLCQARNRDSPPKREREAKSFLLLPFLLGGRKTKVQGSKGVGGGEERNGNGGSFGLPWKIRNIPPEATIERCSACCIREVSWLLLHCH